MMSTTSQDQMINASSSSVKQRQFTGRVTKLLDNFGFVDDDVFFQLSVVKGNVQLGSEVYVECQYSEQLPFKWNATKIEPMSRQASNQASGQASGQASIASTYLQHRMLNQQKQHDPLAQSYYVQDMANNQAVNSQSQPVYATDYKQTQYASTHQSIQANIQPAMSQPNQASTGQAQGAQSQPYSDYSQMNYFSRQQQEYNNSQFPHITYTSMPGSAFLSTQIMPYTQQQQQQQQQPPQSNNKVQQKQSAGNQRSNFENSYKAVGSRWEENRNRNENRGRREQRNRFEERERNRERDRQRDRNQADWNSERPGERAEKSNERDRNRFSDYDRDKHSSREKDKNELDKRRSTESPVSTTSGTSKGTRRRYDPINIPKYSLLKPVLTVYDIKQKYGTSIHIPSDFKEVRVDPNMNLNVMNIPKPIIYRICDRTGTSQVPQEADQSREGDEKTTNTLEKMAITSEKKEENSGKLDDKEKSIEPEKAVKCEKSFEEKNDDSVGMHVRDSTLIIKEPKINICNKYAVKVLLISLPSMNDIYDRVFGSDRDNYSNSKAYFLHFNKLFSFLCSKNHNEGHALIGGKFDASLDGFLDNSQSPNLIATAIRCVKQQTGIDLSSCKRWKHIISFVYNRDDSLAKDAPLEFSYIFFPDVWSILGDSLFKVDNLNITSQDNVPTLDSSFKNELVEGSEFVSQLIKNQIKTEAVSSSISSQENVSASFQQSNDSKPCVNSFDLQQDSALNSLSCSSKTDSDMGMFQKQPTTESNLIPLISDVKKEDSTQNDENAQNVQSEHKDEEDKSAFISKRQALLNSINELKVADLKTHLESRGVKVKSNAKKPELINKLREVLLQEFENDEETSDSVKENWWAKQILSKGDKTKKIETNTEQSMQTNVQQLDNSQQVDNKGSAMSQNVEKELAQEVVDEKQCKGETDEQDTKAFSNDKRKTEFEANHNVKKVKVEESSQSTDYAINRVSSSKSTEDCIVASGDMNLCVISLHQALIHHKYDHFELVVTGELIKEELIRHFSHYILSTLLYNKGSKSKDTDQSLTRTPIDNNYALLAFAYFDSCHCGYILVDDLLKLFHNSNISLSKKVWTSLLGTDDKICYRSFKEPEKLIDLIRNDFDLYSPLSNSSSSNLTPDNCNVFVKDGNFYDVSKLINQAEQDELIKMELKDKVKILFDKLEKQKEQIKESEAKQSRIDVAIEKSNDEICALKREKELLKTKYKEMHDALDSWLGTFTDMMKKHKDEKK